MDADNTRMLDRLTVKANNARTGKTLGLASPLS